MRWQALSALAETDLVLGRLVEAHSDADAILHELEGRRVERGRTYGVWAAQGPLLRWKGGRLTGVKDWCSGATLLSHALVTTSDGLLVEVDLHQPEVVPGTRTWASQGMLGADTRSVRFDGAHARPVEGDYLERPGFWAGGIGVAACWYGGAASVVLPLQARVDSHLDDAHAAAHLGACAVLLEACRSVLREAAQQVDAGGVSMAQALRARALVADTSVEVIRRVGRGVGPAPLAQNRFHARQVADLEVYVRQDHAERDLAVIGADCTNRSWSL